MKRWLPMVAAPAVLLAACETESRIPTQAAPPAPASQAARSQQGRPHGHVFRAFRPAESSGSDNNPIQYNGGPIIYAQKVAAIYWSDRTIYTGGPAPGTTGAGTGDNSLVGFFLNHLGGSPYYNINTTYYDGNGTHVQNSLTYTQYWAPNTNVPTTGSNVSFEAIQAQLQTGFTSGALTFDPNTVYLVFTDSLVDQDSLFPNSACAEHNHFNWNGNDVKFGAMPRAIDQVGCRQADTIPGAGSPNNDQVADVEVNLIAHEIEETNTDPDPFTGWNDTYNNRFFENADKCAWQFYIPAIYTTGNGAKANMNLGGKDFLIQQNWVNAAGVNCALEYLTVGVSGPNFIASSGTYTWTANPAGGDPRSGYSYQWSVFWTTGPNAGNTVPLGTDQSQSLYVDHPGSGSFTMQVTVTNGVYNASGSKGVFNGF